MNLWIAAPEPFSPSEDCRSLILRRFQLFAHVGATPACGAKPIPPGPVPGVRDLQVLQKRSSLFASLFEANDPVLLLRFRKPHAGQAALDPAMDERLKCSLAGEPILV